MDTKKYLIHTFRYNDYANKLALGKMRELPEKQECVKWFSHLINSMNKWLGRMEKWPGYLEMDWFAPVYSLEDLEPKWDDCLAKWIGFIESKTNKELDQEVEFIGFDGTSFAVKLVDIALQLNYHSIHHRAQIQMLIRAQGLEPEFVDYIGTVYRRLD